NSSSLPWATDRSDALREGALSPPPAKRSRSTERGTFTPDRGRSPSRGNGDMQESLLGQALEGGPTILTKEKGNSDSSLQAQSTGEDSNSSDTAMSDHGDRVTPKTEPSDYPMLDDHHPFNTNGGLIDQTRTPTFPGALLGLQGLGGLMPGPSGIHNSTDNFGAAQANATNCSWQEKPKCQYCGRLYSNPSNLRQHIINVHVQTSQENWRVCNFCGKKCKTKHYLINHQLQAHGIRQRQHASTY
ncbi:hypothetical protein BDFB_003809, partial [Asbolus verrucosus]